MSEDQSKIPIKWTHPSEVMKLHQLKRKKKALQARINSQTTNLTKQPTNNFNDILTSSGKRKNPFIINSDNKRPKQEIETEESSDQTLFKLFNLSNTEPKNNKENITDFNNLLSKLQVPIEQPEVKVIGEKWIPIDWTLKSKVRFLSTKPFNWSSKLKTSDEASGITSFARCLDTGGNKSSLDTSPNAQFHQCCLYWQQPCLPWLNLFPRIQTKASSLGVSVASTSNIRDSLHRAFGDSFRSLFQLIRTRQCPYFYACVNSFTILFRAAGICGFTEMQVLITPTTRGFRHMLRQEDIEFTMPLKKKIFEKTDDAVKNEEKVDEDDDDEGWLESMGINSEEIRRINHVQGKVTQRVESEVDNSEQSLVLIEGLEVQAFYSFLINCKSITAPTGPYAGIPPTLLAPVAFTGASLQALNVRESKVHMDHEDFYSLDLKGPILPHIIHKLCALHPKEISMTATFSNVDNTAPFSKITYQKKTESDLESGGSNVFNEENLSDCGLNGNILRHFCSDIPEHISNIECIKYTSETNSYAWS